MAKAKDTKPAKPSRRQHDWQAIERDYRTGRYTLRELERKHGAPFATIGQRAKREGWTQDLRDAVKAATSAKLIESLVTQESHAATQATVATVQAAAEQNTQVIFGHRAKARVAADVTMQLLAELQATAQLAEHADKLVHILAGDEPDAIDLKAARGVVERALSLNGRASTVKQLCDALRIVVGIERTAFGLDEEAPSTTRSPTRSTGTPSRRPTGRLPS